MKNLRQSEEDKVRRPIGYVQFCIWLLLAKALVISGKSETAVELINNQSFRIQMPVELSDFQLGEGHWGAGKGRAAQQSGSNAIFIADVPAGKHKVVRF